VSADLQPQDSITSLCNAHGSLLSEMLPTRQPVVATITTAATLNMAIFWSAPAPRADASSDPIDIAADI
jgi:hypothetical protein